MNRISEEIACIRDQYDDTTLNFRVPSDMRELQE